MSGYHYYYYYYYWVVIILWKISILLDAICSRCHVFILWQKNTFCHKINNIKIWFSVKTAGYVRIYIVYFIDAFVSTIYFMLFCGVCVHAKNVLLVVILWSDQKQCFSCKRGQLQKWLFSQKHRFVICVVVTSPECERCCFNRE